MLLRNEQGAPTSAPEDYVKAAKVLRMLRELRDLMERTLSNFEDPSECWKLTKLPDHGTPTYEGLANLLDHIEHCNADTYQSLKRALGHPVWPSVERGLFESAKPFNMDAGRVMAVPDPEGAFIERNGELIIPTYAEIRSGAQRWTPVRDILPKKEFT